MSIDILINEGGLCSDMYRGTKCSATLRIAESR